MITTIPVSAYRSGLILLLLFLTGCRPAETTVATPASEPPLAVVTSPRNNYTLRTFVQVLADTNRAYRLTEVLRPELQAEFRPYAEVAPTIRPYRDYWGKIQLVNRLPATERYLEWVLTFSSTWTDLEVFTLGADGSWRSEPNGTFTPVADKPFAPAARGNLMKLILPPGEIATVYFRGSGNRAAIAPSFHLYLQPLDLFYDKQQTERVANALFTGILLMMFFYNVIVYFFGRDRSFLFYSGYLLMVVIYASYAAGDLADWLHPVLFTEQPAYYSFFKVTLFLGLMSYLAFIRSFLDLEQLLPTWDRFFKGLVYLGFPLLLVYLAVAYFSNFSYVLEDRLSSFYIGLVVISCSVFIYPLYKTRDTKGYFVVAGLAIISLGCLLTLASRVLPTPFSIFYLKAAAVVEILIFSLGLAYRQRRQVQAQQAADFALKQSQLLQEERQREAARLKELNDFKSRFYTNITHEFRTPLTVILGMSEQIENNERAKALIQRNGANLLRLINQLLDLSKLESGSLALNPVHGDIILYLQYLTESFYSTAEQQRIRLVFHSEAEAVPMDYDEDKIRQIVYNLLSNALRFTPAGGKIVFHADAVERDGTPWLKLKVKDTGTGIPPENFERIFDRFYQGEQPDGSPNTGTGIGLALTKELVELMKGRISVSSEVGVGTELLILLPIEARATVPAAAPPVAADSPESVPAIDPDPAADSAPAAELPELLLIEDNRDIVTYVESVLAGRYTIHKARDGAAGIEKARELIPDIVISDIMMPKKDGYEVCATLKQDERTSHIPIILLTAKSTQDDKVLGLRYGADAYLTKPFDKTELIVRLKKLIETRRRLQQRYTGGGDGAIAPGAGAAAPSIDELFLQKLGQRIQAQLGDADFGVNQLAEAAQLSQMQLYRKLKALTDQTPSQFIRSYRLQQGLALLKEGRLTVSEIAYEVGFADPSYFSRTFQREFT